MYVIEYVEQMTAQAMFFEISIVLARLMLYEYLNLHVIYTSMTGV